MEKHAQGEYDRANKRAKYDQLNTLTEKSEGSNVAEYSTEDLFNPDGTFKELDSDAFIASIDDAEEEIATPLADMPSTATQALGNQIVPLTTATSGDQDQPLYSFPKNSVRSEVNTSAQARSDQEPVRI